MEKILTVDQIAEMLSLHEDTVRDYFRESRFPGAFKIGYDWRLSEPDLALWIALKKDPEGFIEKELQSLKETPEYKNESDPMAHAIMEYNLRDKLDRALHGKKKTVIPADMIFTGQHDGSKQ